MLNLDINPTVKKIFWPLQTTTQNVIYWLVPVGVAGILGATGPVGPVLGGLAGLLGGIFANLIVWRIYN